MGSKPLCIDVVLEKIGQGRGSKHFAPLSGQLFGTIQGIDKNLLVTYSGLVQIHLPVHQSTCCQVVLYRVDAFGIDYQSVVGHIEHLDNARTTDVALCNACIERVSTQIVQSVHVQLTGYQLVEYFVRVFVLEDAYRQIQLTFHVAVDLFHHQQRDVLVRDSVYQRVLQDMRERAMPNVVHEDSCLYSLSLRVKDVDTLLCQRLHGFRHQVQGT